MKGFYQKNICPRSKPSQNTCTRECIGNLLMLYPQLFTVAWVVGGAPHSQELYCTGKTGWRTGGPQTLQRHRACSNISQESNRQNLNVTLIINVQWAFSIKTDWVWQWSINTLHEFEEKMLYALSIYNLWFDPSVPHQIVSLCFCHVLLHRRGHVAYLILHILYGKGPAASRRPLGCQLERRLNGVTPLSSIKFLNLCF